MKKLYDFDDILIEPVILSDISSRKKLNTRYQFGWYDHLPLMTAPMDTVISKDNKFTFIENGIIPVMPRIKNPDIFHYSKQVFLSYSIDDFIKIFITNKPQIYYGEKVYALIDIANGHMLRLFDVAKMAKKLYGDKLVLMVGNVANPETFRKYCKIGVDYVRIGIGNGNGCLTSVQTGVGYSLPNLISECYKIQQAGSFWSQYVFWNTGREFKYKTKIVADGGFKKNSDVIKALGLGANYVMLGSIFNKSLESAGETKDKDGEVIDQYSDIAKQKLEVDIPLYKTFRGMSTKEVQKELGNDVLKTSEGIIKTQMVEYTLKGWCDNFESYLKSAMSYTGKKELPQFIGGVKFNLISQNAFKRFDK